MTDFLLWAGAQFIIAGYYVAQIEKMKKFNKNIDKENAESADKA